MRSKLKIILPLLLLLAVLGGVYTQFLARPSAEAKPRIAGAVYVLPREFVLNLADDRFAKLNVALVLHDKEQLEASHGAEGGAAPPEGFGPLPQEAAVRDVVTDAVTDARADELIDRGAREALKRRVARAIAARTDVKVDKVLFTDLAVQ